MIEIAWHYQDNDRLFLFDKKTMREYSLCENNYMTKFL
ncbi:hypothetical protein HMPREF9243_0112 [Aerococcus sp. Group 1]|nr:hypothetical protein HMPREF9243_0112 [Aerococcus sp. Group 1]